MAQVGSVTVSDNGDGTFSVQVAGEGRAYNAHGVSGFDIGPSELDDFKSALVAVADDRLNNAKAALADLTKQELATLQTDIAAAIAVAQ